MDQVYKVAEVVTPSDSVNFAGGQCQGLYVGVTGDVVAIMAGTAVTLKAMPVGVHRIACTRVNSTSTTATNMVALYGA